MMKTRIFCGLLAVLISPVVRAADLPAPEAWGPYPVGVMTTLLTDAQRDDPATGGKRALPTEIWYPAADHAGESPRNTLLDYFGGEAKPELVLLLQVAFGVDLNAVAETFECRARRGAPAREGRFPLVLFSHGNGGLRWQNTFLCEHLASHGYIVMAPDHTGNCAVTYVKEAFVPMDASKEARERSASDRPRDISFLIDVAESWNKTADSPLAGRIDTEHIGVTGHSFGGFTSAWVAEQEPRVDAIAPIAGTSPEPPQHTLPVLLLAAAEDLTLGAERVEAVRGYYAAAKGPKYFVEFKDGGHYSCTEMHQLKPDFGDGVGAGKRLGSGEPVTYPPMEFVYRLTDGYMTAFFGKYLKGEDGYNAYLEKNHAPEALVAKWNPAGQAGP